VAEPSFVVDILADGVLESMRGRDLSGGGSAASCADWLRHVASPPPGVALVSPDGALFTGVALLERSRPVVLIAIRHRAEAGDRGERPSTYSSHRPFGSPPGYFDPDAEYWHPDGDPYHR
jgi:hypothetical protein